MGAIRLSVYGKQKKKLSPPKKDKKNSKSKAREPAVLNDAFQSTVE